MPDDVAAAIKQAREARRQGRLGAALARYSRAVTMAKAAELTAELIDALEGVGQVQRDLGRSDAARCSYLEAVAVSRHSKDSLRLGHALRHLADIERDRGNEKAALRAASEAVEIYRQYQDVTALEMANALRTLALAQENSLSFAAALATWREARGLYEAEAVEAGLKECDARLGRQK